MVEFRSYSIDELEELTGFNQRTISYYVQQGLLPKVGRRGRSTRYPQQFLERLNFIKRVRDLQDSGRLGSVTLPRIARVIWHLVGQSADHQELPELSDEEIQRLFSDETVPDERSLGKTASGERVTIQFGKFGPYVRAGEQTASIDAEEFNSITLDTALERVAEKSAEKERRVIKEFGEEGIRVLDGRYGPYIRHRGVNVKIPKDVDPTMLTVEDCEWLLEAKRQKSPGTSASRRREQYLKRVELKDSARAELMTRMRRKPRALDTGYLEVAKHSPEAQQRYEKDADIEVLASPDCDAGPAFSRIYEQNQLDRLVKQIQSEVNLAAKGKDTRTETWTRVPIAENIEIAVQGLNPERAALVELLAKKIRRILGVD